MRGFTDPTRIIWPQPMRYLSKEQHKAVTGTAGLISDEHSLRQLKIYCLSRKRTDWIKSCVFCRPMPTIDQNWIVPWINSPKDWQRERSAAFELQSTWSTVGVGLQQFFFFSGMFCISFGASLHSSGLHEQHFELSKGTGHTFFLFD